MSSANALRQPNLRVKLTTAATDHVSTLGVLGLRCRLDLYLDPGDGRPTERLPFVVDSGASYSLVSLALAEDRFLPVPPPEVETNLQLRTPSGFTVMRVRPGRVRGWWNEGRQGYPFDWPVLFRVGAPPGTPSILGLGGVVKTCRWTFDGTYAPDAPHGYLSLDDIR